MKTLQYQGKEIEVVEVEVLTETERWNEYQLANGGVLAIKLVLVKVCKAVNEKNPDGTALYMVNSQNIVKVKSNE